MLVFWKHYLQILLFSYIFKLNFQIKLFNYNILYYHPKQSMCNLSNEKFYETASFMFTLVLIGTNNVFQSKTCSTI